MSAELQPEGRHSRSGQATTEMVLLFPIFIFFLFMFAKIFALLVLTQKTEIAGYYGARRWQLQSHRNVTFVDFDSNVLQPDIQTQIQDYLGCNSPGIKGFLRLNCNGGVTFTCVPTTVWNICTLAVSGTIMDPGSVLARIISPSGKNLQYSFSSTKYVPNRDRPIAYLLPGTTSGP